MNEKAEFCPYGFQKENLISRMKETGVNGILLGSIENVYYTTCYTVLPSSGNPILYSLRKLFPFFSFISEDGEVALACWGYSTLGVKFGVDKIFGFSSTPEALATLTSMLKGKLPTGATLGIETSLPYFVLDLLNEKVKPGNLAIVDDYLLEMRLIKSEKELLLLKKSIEIIEKTLLELYDSVHIGMSRLDLTQEAKTRLFQNGAMGISHITFTFGKANPEIAIGETLDPNRLVVLDLGGIYKGYASDNRRYAYTGKVPNALNDHYMKMVEIVDRVGDTLIPGNKYSDIYQRVLDLYRANGIDFNKNPFNHVGHNIGLETEEDWLTDNPDQTVKTGMVINIELYTEAPNGDTIGNEETYVVSDQGPIRISTLPREIRSIS